MTRSTVLLLASLLVPACVADRPAQLVPDAAPVPPPDSTASPAPAAGGVAPGALFQLIDDMESGVNDFPSPVGLCSWYARGGAAEVEELAPPHDGSRHARHASARQSGGVDMRIDFHGPQFPRVPYPDFSRYAGVTFWARGAPGAAPLTVAIQDDRVAGQASYQQAQRSPAPWLERSVTLSSGWRRHILLFDDFRAPGQPAARLNAAAIWSVHFLSGAGDFWIDDLALLCRGDCPAPPWEVGETAPGLDEAALSWVRGQGATPDLRCAELASLTMTPLVDVAAGPDERLFLRARIPVQPRPSVPLWGWFVENLATGADLPVTTLDEPSATAVISLVTPGSYRLRVHTHYPGQDVCGAELTFQAR
jgi:hypothetical protein